MNDLLIRRSDEGFVIARVGAFLPYNNTPWPVFNSLDEVTEYIRNYYTQQEDQKNV